MSVFLSKFADPNKTVVAVKKILSVDGGLSILVSPDDSVVSCQPDGRLEHRPAGADGGYERCSVQGNLATFRPDEKQHYSFAFVLVDGL